MPRLHTAFPLRRGNHLTRSDGVCAMELVAWLAGERHNDSPKCTSPVITAFVRAFNDLLPSDAAREYYLRAWVPRLVNTVGSVGVEKHRGLIVVDFMVRSLLPMRLRALGRKAQARELAQLKSIGTTSGAILAGLAVKQECGHREVAWAIGMATSNRPPSLWVPVTAKLIKEIGEPGAYDLGVKLVARLVKAGSCRFRPDRDRRTAPPSV